jgi:hypothetical protein
MGSCLGPVRRWRASSPPAAVISNNPAPAGSGTAVPKTDSDHEFHLPTSPA